MTEIGLRAAHTARELSSLLMGPSTLAFGKRANTTVKASTRRRMERSTQVNSRSVSSTVSELSCGLMAQVIRASGEIAASVEEAGSRAEMVPSTSESGLKANTTERES
jgi:hypothetical protein